jgi:hypothetical protein
MYLERRNGVVPDCLVSGRGGQECSPLDSNNLCCLESPLTGDGDVLCRGGWEFRGRGKSPLRLCDLKTASRWYLALHIP